MNLKEMKKLNIIMGVLVMVVYFLSSFFIIEYFTLVGDFKFILWFVFSFLIFMFLTYYEESFCKKGIKKFSSKLVDENVRRKLMNYFFKENFIRNKYSENDDIDFFENKEKNNMIFRSYVTDLRLDDTNKLDINLIDLFNKLIEEADDTKMFDKSDLWCRNFVFLITDKFDEKKFATLDKYTFIKPMKNRYFTSDDLGAFVIPVVLCTEDRCIYFTNPPRYPFFFEKRKLDVLKLFEVDSK